MIDPRRLDALSNFEPLPEDVKSGLRENAVDSSQAADAFRPLRDA